MTEIMKRDGDRWREMPAGQRLVWHRGVPALVERRGSDSRSLPVVQPREGTIRRLLTKLFQR
jgi:hypothetical protein